MPPSFLQGAGHTGQQPEVIDSRVSAFGYPRQIMLKVERISFFLHAILHEVHLVGANATHVRILLYLLVALLQILLTVCEASAVLIPI
jgi:hypothetical protein